MNTENKKLTASRRKEAVAARKRNQELRSRVSRWSFSIIVILVAFALGFWARGFEPITTRLGFTPVSLTTSVASSTTKTTYNAVSPRLAEVEDALTGTYDELDVETATPLVLEAAVKSVGDSYMRYFSAERYEQYVRENKSTEYEGIGALFAEYEGTVYVADVFEGGPADLAGVHTGDVLKAIDGVDVSHYTVNEVISAIAAKSESAVFKWARPASMGADTTNTFSTTLTIQSMSSPNVVGAMLDDNVGYINVTQLSSTASSMVASAYSQLREQGATSIVLDLRDCSGGYLTSAVDIASQIIKSGTVVQIQTPDTVTNKTASGSANITVPVVVLVNGRTAAAAEVLAGALQDNKAATLVGVTTLGKGSVQAVQKLTFGGAIRYTAAYYLTAAGYTIQGKGISPDVSVEDADDQLTVAQQTAATLAATA